MSLTPSIDSLKHLATDTLKVSVAVPARAYGLAKGSAVAGARLLGYGEQPESSWRQATDSLDTSRPVNVHDELGLDPAPVDRLRERRTPPVTDIDAQAEPRLVDSTPADVAERIARGQ